MPKINPKNKAKDLSIEQIVNMMRDVWKDLLKNLTAEEIDLKYANNLCKRYEERISKLEREVHKLQVKGITSA